MIMPLKSKHGISGGNNPRSLLITHALKSVTDGQGLQMDGHSSGDERQQRALNGCIRFGS
tara:strand:- start:24579 stop:24758 length:180 start_codon:yes stop_codon:yes gene_type:complete